MAGPDRPRSPRSTTSALVADALAVARALALVVLVAELGVRVVRPSLPIQVVRAGEVNLRRGPGGVPVWESRDAPFVERCAGAAGTTLRILVVGSSISAGTGTPIGSDFPARLAPELAGRTGRRVCVLNRAQPAFTFEAKAATLAANVRRDRPDLVIYEAWANDGARYRLLGDAAYATSDLRVDGDGYPDAFGLPPGLSQPLFRNSRLYETLSLRLAGRTGEHPPFPADRIYAEVVVPVRAAGADVLVLTAVALDRPFESAPDLFEREVSAMTERHAVPYVSLRDLLRGLAPESVRLDPCCHFAADGAAEVARRLAPEVATWLARPRDDGPVSGAGR